MSALTVLCDVVGRYGGTERYWETVMPELACLYEVRLLARAVEEPGRFGVPAREVAWGTENEPPSASAAAFVQQSLTGCDTVITANVFDPLVLGAVRSRASRWIARIHDYRPLCPNGNKIFPQFSAVCRAPMGAACAGNAIVRGCIRGPRVESVRRIAARMRVRDGIARADRVLVSSAYMRDVCVQNGIDPQRIVITPPPLPDDAFADPGCMPQANRVLYAGRFNESKGLGSLIRALALIPAAQRPQLVVAGTGDAEEERRCRSLAARGDVEVLWRGWLSQTDLRKEIDDSRVLVLPSLWPEPFGLAGTEAQARARPVAAYDVGGVREWIAGGGIVVARADEPSLARAIATLTTDPEQWMTYALGARKLAERFRLSEHIRRLQDVLALGAEREAVT